MFFQIMLWSSKHTADKLLDDVGHTSSAKEGNKGSTEAPFLRIWGVQTAADASGSSHSLRNFAKKNSPTLCKQTSSHEEFGEMATAPSGVATVVS